MIEKCRRCKKDKVIIGFGYCRDCAIALGANLKEDINECKNT